MKPTKRLDGEMAQRAENAIAHGALTNSKRPESFVKGVYPQHLSRGLGAYVWDTLGNQYVDMTGALGSNLLGYAQEEICEAIARRSRLGTSLPLGTELEVQCAERVKEFFPFIERVRFLKTGSEACSAALRIARVFTERQNVMSEGYHGWHDEFTYLTLPARGVPHQSHISKPTLLKPNKDTAAVIVEPVQTDYSEERKDFLKRLRQECSEAGALLIFDEVITGFRVPEYSIAKNWDVTPDLICLGKCAAGGMPLSIVGGLANVMESDYFVSSTFAGETVTLSAAMKFMDLLSNKFQLPFLWEKGAQFLASFNKIWGNGVSLEGYPTRMILKAHDESTKALFMQECCKAGILMGPSVFFTFPHIELMDELLSSFSDILIRLRMGEFKLEGELPKTPFAQKARSA